MKVVSNPLVNNKCFPILSFDICDNVHIANPIGIAIEIIRKGIIGNIKKEAMPAISVSTCATINNAFTVL